MKKMKLFCFPFAGGSAAAFNKWRQYLDKDIEIHPVEFSGRGRRIYDPLYDSIEEAVTDIHGIIGGQMNEGPYAFFGHSMGGIIAYELARKVRDNNEKEPLHVFYSGRGAPHVEGKEYKKFYDLPEEEFKKEIIDLGGTPKEFFEYPELLDVLMPMLRSDFKIAETYERVKDQKPFGYDISVLLGKKEEVTPEQMVGWREVTRGVCSVHYFEGDHFFINEQPGRVVKVVNNTLKNL
ncbi:MAG: thioesterase [bacterium]|nr:thioesterase [bacterium]